MTAVLVVGHEPDLTTLACGLLELEGHSLQQAADGQAALALLRSCPDAMVVVLLTTRAHVHTRDILEAAVAERGVMRHAFVLLTGVGELMPARWRELIGVLGIPVLAKPMGISRLSRTVAEVAVRLPARRV